MLPDLDLIRVGKEEREMQPKMGKDIVSQGCEEYWRL